MSGKTKSRTLTPICDYCGKPSEKVTGKEIYRHRPDLHSKTFYRCEPCGAYVGCHPGTDRPLGRLANATLRQAKSRTHKVFDQIWKDGHMKRGVAYEWLAEMMGIPKEECHIGMMSVERCNQATSIAMGFFRAINKGNNDD